MKRNISIAFALLLILSSCGNRFKYAVIVSANMEWNSLKKVYSDSKLSKSVWGEYFIRKVGKHDVLFFHEGWGKVAAAGATQYVIDKYDPEILINIGTCGGFEGEINRFETILADRTVIYDIIEAMGDSKEAIADYTSEINLEWLGKDTPFKVRKTVLVSGDKDLRPDETALLKKEYGAVAGDWESGAIAYTAKRNNKKILILRGVSDLVSSSQGEAYGNFDLFIQRTDSVMAGLIKQLPGWINYIDNQKSSLTGTLDAKP